MTLKTSLPLRIDFYRERDAIIAHCLELDLLGDGETHRHAAESLAESIRMQAGEGVAAMLFRAAPSEYWQRFAVGEQTEEVDAAVSVLRQQFGPLDVPSVEGRAFDADEDRSA